MEKIRLSNGNTYEIEGGASEFYFTMMFGTLEEIIPVILDFTEENMSSVEFLVETDQVCGEYKNKYLDRAEIIPQKDGSYRVGFVVANVDMVEKRLLNIESSQELQDEAIVELANIVAG